MHAYRSPGIIRPDTVQRKRSCSGGYDFPDPRRSLLLPAAADLRRGVPARGAVRCRGELSKRRRAAATAPVGLPTAVGELPPTRAAGEKPLRGWRS